MPPDLDAASLAALGDGEIVALALRTVTLPPTGALAAMGPPIHVSGNTFIGNWDPSTESQIMQAIRKAMRRGL